MGTTLRLAMAPTIPHMAGFRILERHFLTACRPGPKTSLPGPGDRGETRRHALGLTPPERPQERRGPRSVPIVLAAGRVHTDICRSATAEYRTRTATDPAVDTTQADQRRRTTNRRENARRAARRAATSAKGKRAARGGGAPG